MFRHFLLKFGLIGLMVIDNGSNFKGTLTCVCECLKIPVYLLDKSNDRGLSVKRFRRALDKTTTIASEDRGHQQSNFTAIDAATVFAWNSAAIDNTNCSDRPTT